jgi:hypothetical protein
MGFFLDHSHSLCIYDCPKSGGTTLRIWLYFLLTGQLVENVRGDSYYHGTTRMLDHLLANGYMLSTYSRPPENAEVWQLVRCPFDRFASLVRDKVMREGWHFDAQRNGFVADPAASASLTFEEGCKIALSFLTDGCRRFEGNLSASYVHYHFCPQVNHVGKPGNGASLQGRVTAIETKDIAQLKARLEVLYGRSLPSIHARDSRFGAVPVLPAPAEWPPEVRAAVLDFYAEDFAMLEQVTRDARSL